MCEVHAINTRNRGRHGKDRGPSSQLAGNCPLPLLLQQPAGFDYGGKRITQPLNAVNQAPNMVEQVAHIRINVRVHLRQFKVDKAAGQIFGWSQYPLQTEQLAAQHEYTAGFGGTQKIVDRALFHDEHLFLHHIDQVTIAINDEVQYGVEDVIRTLPQQPRCRLKLIPNGTV